MAAAHPILAFYHSPIHVHANGAPMCHHLHRPWQRAGKACVDSIKGQEPLAHLLAERGLGHI